MAFCISSAALASLSVSMALSDEMPTVPLAVVAPCDEQPVPIF